MNLILWRHAEAQDGTPDLARELTTRGLKQADRMAGWLRAQLPGRFQVLASPARRTRQTADALGVDFRIEPNLAPDLDVAHYLAAAAWPEGPAGCGGTVVLVGHQPMLGRTASLLLCGQEQDWSVRKGAVWWLTTREREGRNRVVLRAVINPEQL